MAKQNGEHILSTEERKVIADIIARIELKTSAELRVGIRLERKRGEHGVALAELALNEFYYLGMDKTGMRTGVLFFFLISEKEHRLMLDESIYKKIEPSVALEIENKMKKCYSSQSFFEPLKESLNALGEILAKEFPILPDDVNELPNDVSIR